MVTKHLNKVHFTQTNLRRFFAGIFQFFPKPAMGAALMVFLLIACGAPATAAADEFLFNPSNSNITGSVQYAALGRYKANFELYRGVLKYDRGGTVKSVALVIKAASLKSNCPLCDKAARSTKLLSVKEFPNIRFRDNKISKKGKQYVVDGVLSIHGVDLPIQFPFKQEPVVNADGSKAWLIRGSWDIPRKKFGIVWSHLLDHGGVVVGDYITVDWDMRIPQE